MAQTTTQTGAGKKTENTPDAIALLKADHRKVEDLFESFEKARGADRKQKLVHEICLELKVHTTIEEEIFYPACRGKIEDDMVDEAYVEHDAAKKLISELEASGPDEEFYDAKVKVLQEEIEHHVEEEEKRAEGMFAQAKKAGLDMDELGMQMSMRKDELMRDAKGGLEPPAEPTTFKE
jgi:hemerythrin superfamily protein